MRLGIRVRAEEAEPALAALLPLLRDGAEEVDLGAEVEYALYGRDLPGEAEIRALAGDAVVAIDVRPVPAGWETRWHEHLRPVVAGPFTIRPPWVDGSSDDLIIDPGALFGAGTHPTTRLALELLADAEPAGPLCDWGAGTGVLAIAAARLGWAPVTAVEIEPEGTEVIAANAARNGVAVRAERGDVRAAPWAPAVVANLTRELLVAAAGAAERAPSLLIASGMLAQQAGDVAAAWAPHGLRVAARRERDGWAALALRP